jgi:hypothetical protein
VARERKRPMAPGEAVQRAATRRARPAGGTSADQVRALEGRYGRAGARERLGVSERTMRRYRAGGAPSRANAAKIQREASISPRREARLRNRGAYVRMSGKIGADTPGKGRRGVGQRHRTIGDTTAIHLSGDQMAEILDAYHAGDEEGAIEALREALGEEYFGGVTFDDLTRLEFLRDNPAGGDDY